MEYKIIYQNIDIMLTNQTKDYISYLIQFLDELKVFENHQNVFITSNILKRNLFVNVEDNTYSFQKSVDLISFERTLDFRYILQVDLTIDDSDKQIIINRTVFMI